MEYQSFNVIKKRLQLVGWDEGKDFVLVSRNSLKVLFKEYAKSQASEFDEEWYLSQNRDVSDNLATSDLETGLDHFINHGYFENRMPRPIEINWKLYLDLNPDVHKNLSALEGESLKKSAIQHYIDHGYREGRPISR